MATLQKALQSSGRWGGGLEVLIMAAVAIVGDIVKRYLLFGVHHKLMWRMDWRSGDTQSNVRDRNATDDEGSGEWYFM